MHEMDEIEEFINRRFSEIEIKQSFKYGNCYYFAVILNHRFPYTEIVYLGKQGHFCVRHNNLYYDITGKIDSTIINNENVFTLEWLNQTDPMWYDNLMKWCKL